MTRELTKEQAEFMAHFRLPEVTEEARRIAEEYAANQAAMRASAEKRWAAYQEKCEEERRQRAIILQPLKDALRTAGIRLALDSDEAIWGHYQIGDGPIVRFDIYDFDTFEEED